MRKSIAHAALIAATLLGGAADTGGATADTEGGGVVVTSVAEAIEACRRGEIPDMKTEIALVRLCDLVGYVPSLDLFVDEKARRLFGRGIYSGETYQAGIGQGYDIVTPIQLITAYCALANGGKLYRPQVVRTITAADGSIVRDFQPELIRKLPISSKTLRDDPGAQEAVAIAEAKLAAARALKTRVFAGDIDPVAVRAAHANARLNRCAAYLRPVTAPGLSHPALRGRQSYDLIFANILARPLRRRRRRP